MPYVQPQYYLRGPNLGANNVQSFTTRQALQDFILKNNLDPSQYQVQGGGGSDSSGRPLPAAHTIDDVIPGYSRQFTSQNTPVSPQPATPPAGPITPDQNIPPLPNIPGLSTPNLPNTPATPQSTPVNVATVPQTDISPYIPTTSQQQQDVINHAITQSQGVANQNVQSLQDIMGPYVQSQVKNWTDPNSPDYQSTMGQLNNFGRADPNTFAQSLSSRLAPLIGQNMMTMGTSALTPSFQNQQNLVSSGASTQSNLGLASLQRFIDLQNFEKQAALSNQLADKGQPSGAQQGIGGAASLLQGLGQFGQGFGGFKQLLSGCFLSTACTEAMHLPDNCDELETLRGFRDGYVSLIPGGTSEIKAYYAIAPKIVEKINSLDSKEEIYREIYDSIVLPCVVLIKEGSHRAAFTLYKQRTQELCERYTPEALAII